jgi:hypothetical protein
MITNWIDEGGHLRLADFPTTPIGDTAPPSDLIPTISYCRTRALPKDGPRPNVRLLSRNTGRSTWLPVYIVIGALGTDASGKLWTLMIDSCSTQHTGESELSNYSHYFGIDAPSNS